MTRSRKVKVKIKFFAGLRKFSPNGDGFAELSIEDDSTVADILKALKVPPEKPSIILINGVHGDRDSSINDGDTISVFPPVAGG